MFWTQKKKQVEILFVSLELALYFAQNEKGSKVCGIRPLKHPGKHPIRKLIETPSGRVSYLLCSLIKNQESEDPPRSTWYKFFEGVRVLSSRFLMREPFE